MAFQQNRLEAAAQALPDKEQGGFIHTLEEQWLAMLRGQGSSEKLIARGKNLEDLGTLRVSRELADTFGRADPQAYYPAEHEVILYHMATAMILLRDGEVAKAQVELRRATRYLQGSYAPHRQDFDCPSLRVWLAALRAATGDWDSARVDLRVAARLAPEANILKTWSESPHPPARISLLLLGSGPTPTWEPLKKESPYPFAGLDFQPSRKLEAFVVSSGDRARTMQDGLSHDEWYRYHQVKNQLLSDVIRGSAQGGQAVVVGAASAAQLGLATAVSGLLMVGGIGGGVILAVQIGGELGVALGLSTAATGYLAGSNLYGESKSRSQKWLERGIGQVESYRFVRFLPDHLLFDFDSTPAERAASLRVQAQSGGVQHKPWLILHSPTRETEIVFFLDPSRSSRLVDERNLPRHFFDGVASYFLHEDEVSTAEAQALCAGLSEPDRRADLPLAEGFANVLQNLERGRGLFPAKTLADLGRRSAFWVKKGDRLELWTRDGSPSLGGQGSVLCWKIGAEIPGLLPIYQQLRQVGEHP